MDPTLEHLNFIWSAAGDYGMKLLAAIAIWFIGTTIAKIIGDSVRGILSYQDGLDPSIANFAARATRWIGLLVVVVLILNVFGINSSSIAAMVGAMTLAIGLALRDTLANVAAGLMILVMRPFLTGHYVEIGDITGTVRMINLFNTEIASRDNIQILVPNQQVWQSAIKNYSAYSRRRLEMVVGIDYSANVDRAVEIVRGAIDGNPRALRDPEPFVRVTALADSSVDLTIRVWCQSRDVNNLKFDLTKTIKERFDQAGISIPYPHMEIIHRAAADPSSDQTPSDRGVHHH